MTVAKKKSGEPQSESTMSIQQIKKSENSEKPKVARYFLVDFTISFKRPDGTNGILNDTVGLGKLYNYPSKIEFTEQIQVAYGITQDKGFSEIVVYGIRPWTISEQDYLDFTKQ